jgi:hypothetical protein
MKLIRLPATGWTHIDEFFDAILKALAAPKWHGHNVNALIESMIHGEINGISPPYKIVIYDTGLLMPSLKEKIAAQLFYIVQARDEAAFVARPDIRIVME